LVVYPIISQYPHGINGGGFQIFQLQDIMSGQKLLQTVGPFWEHEISRKMWIYLTIKNKGNLGFEKQARGIMFKNQ
jgi:hypothetical protein